MSSHLEVEQLKDVQIEKEQLEKERKQLRSEQVKFKKDKKALSERQKSITIDEKRLQKWETSLSRQDKELKIQVNQQYESQKQFKKDQDKEKEDLAQKWARLQTEKFDLESLLQEFDFFQENIETSIAKIREIFDGMSEREETIKNRDKDLDKLSGSLDKKKASLDELEMNLQNSRKKLEQHNREFQQKKIAFQHLLQSYGLDEENTHSKQLRKLPDKLITLLLSQNSVHKTLRAEISKEFSEQEKLLVRHETEITEKEMEIEIEREDLQKLKETTEQRRQENKKLEQGLKALAQSILDSPKIEVPEQKKRKLPIHSFKTEIELVSHVKEYIQSRGFYYAEGIVENFYTCLKSGYLVILSGISGVGKSKLPQLFTEAIDGRFELVPVRPDWNDDRDLLGFFNATAQRYQTTRFIEFLLQANADRDRLHIVCLDEMNLAPVEYYFAQFLSVLENNERSLTPPDETLTFKTVERFQEQTYIEMVKLEDKLSRANDVLHESISREINLLNELLKDLELYQNIPISPNVKFVGTVNVDHTTHGFSDKVLDRANVIQFERVELNKLPKKKKFLAKGLNYSQFNMFCEQNNLAGAQKAEIKNFDADLRKIARILEITGLNIGFRIRQSVAEYMHLAVQGEYFDDPHTAFDFQIKQRILPKIRGMRSPELKEGLEELKNFLRQKKYFLSLEKVAGRTQNRREYGGMLQQLEAKGYVNYWEIR